MNYLTIAVAIAGFITIGAALIALTRSDDYRTLRDYHRNRKEGQDHGRTTD